jgi:hypothetical protein
MAFRARKKELCASAISVAMRTVGLDIWFRLVFGEMWRGDGDCTSLVIRGVLINVNGASAHCASILVRNNGMFRLKMEEKNSTDFETARDKVRY